MARVEAFTYGPYVVGGAAPTDTTQIAGRFSWDFDGSENDESVEYGCEFILTGTSFADLNTRTASMLAALRTRYQKLSVDWGGSNVALYDPLVANGATGFEAEPRIRKSRNVLSTGLTRGFEFRLRVQLAPNYTDPNLPGTPAAAGRRTSTVTLGYDASNRRTVTIDGAFTETSAGLPRTFTSSGNNPSGAIETYCNARLAIVDPTATWAIVRRSEKDTNAQGILTFAREYAEHLFGRRGSSVQIRYLPSGARLVTIRGTYLRTQSGFPTPTSTAASVNYADGTNGGKAYAEATQLKNLTSAQGGALLVAGQGTTNCEFVGGEATPNEQDDRLDYVLVYREIVWRQSNAASSGLDDPDIVNDAVSFVAQRTPTHDSPEPAQISGPGAVAGNGVQGPGAPQFQDASGQGYAGTVERGPAAGQQAAAGTVSTSPGTSIAQKPILLTIKYRAIFSKNMTGTIDAKWRAVIRPYLVAQLPTQVGFGPIEYVSDSSTPSPATLELEAVIVARFYPAGVVAFLAAETVDNDLGLRLSRAFAGKPHAYLVQQALLRDTRQRKVAAIYRTGTAFNIRKYQTVSAIPGWLVVARHFPDKTTTVDGIPTLGQVSLTSEQMIEDMVYVGEAVEGSSPVGGVAPSGGASSGGGLAGADPNGAGAGPAAAMASGGVNGSRSSGQSYDGGAGSDVSGFSFGF